MISLEDYIKAIKPFLTKATSQTLERIAKDALGRLQDIPLEDYLQNPLVCFDGGRRANLGHNKMELARFSELLPIARKIHKKKAGLIDYYKRLSTTTEEEDKKRIADLKISKLHNLFKYHLLPYSDGRFYHWHIDLDNVYDRFDDHPLITNISAELLRQDPCVVYAERSASCGLFALVAADPNRMDVNNQIIPMPTCCVGIKKDTSQDEITQLRYLCGRDEQWQPHPVTYCENYVKTEIVGKNKKDATTEEKTKSEVVSNKTSPKGLNTNILKGTVADLLFEGKNIEDKIYFYAKGNALFDSLGRYNYRRGDLDAIPRKHGDGWKKVKFKEVTPNPRLKTSISLDYRYLNDAISKGAVKLERGKIYIVQTGAGKSYAVAKIATPNNVFLTTRLGLLDEFEKDADSWERLSPKTVIEDGKRYYGTAQGISTKQIQRLKGYDYTFHLDEMHTWFEFDDLREKLNGIINKEPNVIGYTASPVEQLMVWRRINDYEMVDCKFRKEKQSLNLALYKYQFVTKRMLSNLAVFIQSVLDKDGKIVLYLNDKGKIETLAQALPAGNVFTYYTAASKDKTARQEWEDANKSQLASFRNKEGGACLLCTSKMGIGANFHKVVDMFVVFSNNPDSIQQVLARERDNDVTALIFSKTYSDRYLLHEVGWQDVLSDYYRGVIATDNNTDNQVNDKVFTQDHSISIADCVSVIYDTYSEVFYNNLFYILRENWDVANVRTPSSRIFEIQKFKTNSNKDALISNEERIYQGLMEYVQWLDNKPTIDSIFNGADLHYDCRSPLDKDRFLKAFVDHYIEQVSKMSLPPLRTLLEMDKDDVLQTIRKVQRNNNQDDNSPSLWAVIKGVLQEMDLTASFTDEAIGEICNRVNQSYPTEVNVLKTILKQHYKCDDDKMRWVKKSRNRKKKATIQKENEDKIFLDHLKQAGQKVTAKTVAEAMAALQIKGKPETIARRLKRKA